ncbi:MAG: hypothetical protein KatS3mg081_1323 [Gemmatimonadales bacterium]|nr:hypothetical protein HRbin33_00572 [bacterium HR33]GIW51968.1 MAG: hypothetical protein KatS3mg081_1323 [Gemmatimonadales bacterium]
MRASSVLLGVLVIAACGAPDMEEIRRRDLEEAEQAFRSNIAAIHRRDAEGYLAHYLDSPELVIAGGDSLRRGFLPFAEARRASNEWPDTLIAGEPVLVWLAPGVVYGAYPYTVVERGDSSSGWSERVFIKTGGAWKVAVTSRIDRCD